MTSRQPPNHDDDCSCVLCWNDEPVPAGWTAHEFAMMEMQRDNTWLRQELDDALRVLERLVPGWSGSMRSAWQSVRTRFDVLSNELAAAQSSIAALEGQLEDERERRQCAEAELERERDELARLRTLDNDIPHPRRPRRIEEKHHA